MAVAFPGCEAVAGLIVCWTGGRGEADVDGTPFGRYRLIKLLGEVWRAHDTAINNRTVVRKLLPSQLAADHSAWG